VRERRAALKGCERRTTVFAKGHGLPMRGNSHLIICRYGSPLDGIRSIAFLAKGLACSSVCRLSFGSDIHSRMIFRRVSRFASSAPSYLNTGKRWLVRELPKNRRRTEVPDSFSGSAGAVGKHENTPNIELRSAQAP
jgi:hypothetical protein